MSALPVLAVDSKGNDVVSEAANPLQLPLAGPERSLRPMPTLNTEDVAALSHLQPAAVAVAAGMGSVDYASPQGDVSSPGEEAPRSPFDKPQASLGTAAPRNSSFLNQGDSESESEHEVRRPRLL